MCTQGDNGSNTCVPLSTYTYSELLGLAGNYTTEYSWYPDFLLYWLALWGCYLLAQQQTVSIMLVVKSSYTASIVSVALTSIYLSLGSCTVRSHTGLPELMYHMSYIFQSRYDNSICNFSLRFTV